MRSEPEPQLAFIAAGLVLLVMPLLAVFGLSALGFALASSGGTRLLFIAVFLAWIVFVVVAVIVLIGRIGRGTHS